MPVKNPVKATDDVQLCLACQSVFVKKPDDLCAACGFSFGYWDEVLGWEMADFGVIGELSPYIPPAGYGGEGKEKKD